ncbi:MAG TPA: ABC transporter substrate-binding protein, partial [Polyangiaceae bacterium]|nr:ABC transporter substrate-binding protein [Polyangiaceae bacterium]
MRRGGGGALAATALAAAALAAAAPGCNQLAGADEFYVDAPAAPPPAPGEACETNAQCTERAAGEPSLCRKADKVCVRVTSDECAYFVGSALADDAVIVGAIGPTTGVDVLLGQATQNALSLALQDFAAAGGLPPAAPGGPRRQLALVGCDEAKDPIAAARHLVGDLGAPAIVGASASGITAQIAEEVTVAAKVLLISPSATSASLTDLADGGLVWRTAPSDVQQSAALARLAADFAADVRAAIEFATVAVLYKEDSYGKGLFDDISARLKPAGGRGLLGPNDRLFGFSYGNPDDLSVTPDPAASYDLAVD